MVIPDREFDANPYYDPEKCGLELVFSDNRDDDYGHDIVAVWKDIASGYYFWGIDSGCSCPIPFEDYHCISQFEEYLLTKELFEQEFDPGQAPNFGG